jgi:hypothetical protein
MDDEIIFYMGRLRGADAGLAEAQHQRMEWSEKETRCQTTVKSLLQLIVNRAMDIKEPVPEEVVQKALNLGVSIPANLQGTATQSAPPVPAQASSEPHRANEEGTSANNSEEGVNRVEWIASAVAASGKGGITPPEILKLAARTGLSIHKNYPYVVLGKLLERGTVTRSGGRYYKAATK